ncbi:regulator of chromosome condensation domain-containing protein [Dictyostelium discoideum AX4]|uniref:Regulator of chromosome condensation domain-containing protein n=1 Tax=Dictyostelium discoideum TaxID=44689 RepID=Q54BC4_DICDI|nr:regulator of chromosome condensation domain-containing protein [Dictyostelium discoideum AX4]EAL60555.1 regulator of chromosome condensation domain-containing protein [Dictyostelium discoideum AX4]|eukprot:XP_628970.1 regulator of chromosome condensation domain-containing protein [Dictyostelium discoideum AX4]
MDIEQKQFFTEISDLFKSNLLIKAIRLINKKLTTITDNNEFKYKLILILGKLCLKGRNVDTIIPMIENELKTNEIKGSIKFNLMSLLYRCYYLKSSSGSKSVTNNYQYKSKTTTNHPETMQIMNQSDNISDMVLSRNRSVSVQFENETLEQRESKRIKFTTTNTDDESCDDQKGVNGDEKNSVYNFYDDLNFQYYLFSSDLFVRDRIFKFKTPIKSISCGRYFSSILDSNGMVWNWGLFFEVCSNGQASPTHPYPMKKPIKKIASGHHHCIALATDGSVYGWGANTFNSIGIVTSNNGNIKTPTPIEFINYNGEINNNNNSNNYYINDYTRNNNENDSEILKISAGGFNSAFITKNGNLFVCGRNDRFQLGIEETTASPPPLFTIEPDKKYLPSILVASSSITRDYSYLINNKQFSDLHITFGKDKNTEEIAYCHLILLTILENDELLNQLIQLKLKSINKIVKIDIIEFLNLVIKTKNYNGKGDDDDDFNKESNKKIILDQLIEENQLFSNSFIDFISFIYTNTTSKRNMKILFQYSKLFNCKQLTNYLNETSFNIIQEESDLSIPSKLLKRFNNDDDNLSDCTIISNDGKIKIKAHKSILISRLNYFKNLLLVDQIDNSNDSNDSNEIKLNDKTIPDNHLILIIAYLYCDRIKFDLLPQEIVTGDFVLSLCSTSDQLKLTRFKDGLLKLISNSITKENAISLLLWSKNNSYSLERFIKCFISLHVEFINSEHYDPTFLPFPLNQSPANQQTPTHVAKHEKFVDVAVGAKLMLALTVDNKLYQLGIGSDRSRKPIQQITLPFPDENTIIKKISCGSSHWIAVTENNKIYGMGCADLNQLVEGSRKFCYNPTLISDSNKYNNAKAGFYASMYWNDLSNFPLHPNGLNNNNNDNNNNNSLKVDKPITIEVYNSSSSSLWFFKNYDFIDSLLKNKLSGSDDEKQQEQENSNDEFTKSIISTTSACLPPYLYELISNKENGNDNTIQLFGFSKELIEKSFLKTTKDLNINSGDEILDLLFLTTSFGNYKLTNELFGILKKSIDLKQACILFTLIHKSKYSLQLAFLFNYLLGYIGKNRLKILQDTELFNSIPISLLDLISSK